MVANRKRKNKLYEINKLIRLYRANECLWNPKSPGFQNVALKENAWKRISQFFMNKLTVDQVKLQILSLRYYFATELLAIKHSQLGDYQFVPRHPYFKELSFLRDAMVNNVHVRVTEAKDQVSKQINCLVEDAFLLSSSENSIHSERLDFSTPSESDEDDITYAESTESLVSSVGEQYVQLPVSPPYISANQFSKRAVSGNDRWSPNLNYSTYGDEYDNYDRRRSRSPDPNGLASNYSIGSEIVRPNTNQQPIPCLPEINPSRSTTDFPYNSYAESHGSRACGPPKKKVLTGRYRQKSKHLNGAERDTDFCQVNYDSRSHRQQYRLSDGRENNQHGYRYARSSRDFCCKKSDEGFKNQYCDNTVTAFNGPNLDIYVNHVNVQGSSQETDECNCGGNWQEDHNDRMMMNDRNSQNNNNTDNQLQSQQEYLQTVDKPNPTNQPLTETDPTRKPCTDSICPVRSGKSRSLPAYGNQGPSADQQPSYEPKQNVGQQRNDEFANEYEDRGYHDNGIDSRPHTTRPSEQEYDRHYRNSIDAQEPDESRNRRNRTANNNMEDTKRQSPIDSPRQEQRRASPPRATSAAGSKRTSIDPQEWESQRVVCTNVRQNVDKFPNNFINCPSGRQRKIKRNEQIVGRPEKRNRHNDNDFIDTNGKSRPKIDHEQVPPDSYNEENSSTQSRERRDTFNSPKFVSRYPTECTNDQCYRESPQRQTQRGDEGYISPERKERYNRDYVEEDRRQQRDDDANYAQRHHNSEKKRDYFVDNCYATCSSGRNRKYNKYPENYQTGQDDNRRRDDGYNRENKSMSPKYQYRANESVSPKYQTGRENYGTREDGCSPAEPTSSRYQAERDFNEYPANNRSGQEDYRNSDEYKRENKNKSPKYQSGEETKEYERRAIREREQRDNNFDQGQEYYDERDPEKYQARQGNYGKREDISNQNMTDDCDCLPNQPGMDDPQETQDSYNRNREPVAEKYQNIQEDYGRSDDTQELERNYNPNNNQEPKKYQTGQEDNKQMDVDYNQDKDASPPKYQSGQDVYRENQDEPSLNKNGVSGNYQTGLMGYGEEDDYNQAEHPLAPKAQQDYKKRDDKYNVEKEPYKSGDEMLDCECPSDEEEIVTLKPKENETQEPRTSKKKAPCLCEAAVETDIDMTLQNRVNKVNPVCNCSEDSLATAALNEEKLIDDKNNTNENTEPTNTKSKPVKGTKKGGKICACKPPVVNRNKQVAKSQNTGAKHEPTKQRSSSPAGTKTRHSAKRQHKMDEDALNKFQAHGGLSRKIVYETQEEGNTGINNTTRKMSGFEVYQRTNKDGLALLYSFRVPQSLAGQTMSILNRHITNISPTPGEDMIQPIQYSSVSRESPRKYLPESRNNCSSQKHSKNRSDRRPSNPFLKLSGNDLTQDVIVLHPPVKGFRPSKYSFSLKNFPVDNNPVHAMNSSAERHGPSTSTRHY